MLAARNYNSWSFLGQLIIPCPLTPISLRDFPASQPIAKLSGADRWNLFRSAPLHNQDQPEEKADSGLLYGLFIKLTLLSSFE